jgi:hypothetical protein
MGQVWSVERKMKQRIASVVYQNRNFAVFNAKIIAVVPRTSQIEIVRGNLLASGD